MEISRTMDLQELARHIGSDTTESQARHMRDQLLPQFEGLDTADVPDSTWHGMINALEPTPEQMAEED